MILPDTSKRSGTERAGCRSSRLRQTEQLISLITSVLPSCARLTWVNGAVVDADHRFDLKEFLNGFLMTVAITLTYGQSKNK